MCRTEFQACAPAPATKSSQRPSDAGYPSKSKRAAHKITQMVQKALTTVATPPIAVIAEEKADELAHKTQAFPQDDWIIVEKEELPIIAEKEKPIQEAGDEFIHGLGITLSLMVQAATRTATTRFHSSYPPPIGIQQYIQRMRKYFLCSDECFVLALVYINRVGKNNPSMVVCDVSVHRLLHTAVMMAAKFQDDLYYSNAHYAKAGGMCLQEVNLLEKTMLTALRWTLYVSPEEYQLYHALVCKAVVK